jgi:hypothetical protein
MATSTITNTVKDPSGAAVASVPVVIRLMGGGQPVGGFRTSDGSEVAAQITVTANGSGVWTATLEQNANIIPANTYYTAEEQIPAAQGGARTWAFNVGAANANLHDSLLAAPAAAPALLGYSQAASDARYLQLAGGTMTGPLAAAHVLGAGSTPGVTPIGLGTGGSPGASITGTDLAMTMTINTGNTGVGNQPVQVTFASPFAATPRVFCTAGDATGRSWFAISVSTTGFILETPSNLLANGQYIVHAFVIG